MSWHKLTIKSGNEIDVTPISVKKKLGETFLECYVRKDDQYHKIPVNCNEITHFDSKEIFSLIFIRPLSLRLPEFDKSSLRVVLDNLDTVISIDVIDPR